MKIEKNSSIKKDHQNNSENKKISQRFTPADFF